MLENAILHSLPDDERATIREHSNLVHLSQHHTLYRAGDPLEHVYFPRSGMISLLMTAQDGRTIETCMIGREGLVGVEALLAPAQAAAVGAVVQSQGDAIRVPALLVRQSIDTLPVLAELIDRQIAAVLFQAQQNALCHALHSIEARFCRWLLQAGDALASSKVDVTQEACAQILGVQRTSVSMVAHALQGRGALRTQRGKIEILDRPRLEQGACECYLELKRRAQFHQASTRSLPGRRPDEVFAASAR